MRRLNILLFFSLLTSASYAQFVNNGATVTIQAGATLRVETNFVNNAGGTITNNGTLEVQNDFTNAGTFNSGSTSTVKFIGTTNSNVTPGGATLRNVELAKTAENVTLQGPLAINGNLTFTNDNNKVILGAHNLTINTGGGVVSSDANEYVVTNGTGQFVKGELGTTPFTFPVGFDALTYNPITITENGTVDNIGVRVLEKVYVNGSNGTAITTEAVDATWVITEATAGGSNLNVTASWLTADELPDFTRNDCGVAKYIGPNYDLQLSGMGAATGSGTGADPYNRQRNGVTPGNFVVGDDKVMDYVAVSPKAFLHGPYGFSTNSTGLMNDNLRILLPTTEPYTGYTNFTYVGRRSGETVNSSVFAVTGNDAIVDWVFLQVRNTASPYSVVATKSAFIQRDGDIVDTDGGPVKFLGVPAGNYKVAIRHRNHLGIMTDNNKSLSSTTTVLDFSNSTTPEPVFGGISNLNLVSSGSNPAYVMIPGDGNSSGSVTASDNVTIWRPNNSLAVTAGNYLSNVGKADFNLSGSVTASDNVQMWRPNNSKLQSFPNN